MGHGNGYGFGAGLCLLRRQSFSARFEHTDRWEIGRLTASGMQDVRQGIRELQRASQPGLSEGRSVGTHGNGAAAERRSEVQPLVLTGREPEQKGGVTDVSCSCSHSMPLAWCCLFSISPKLNASPRRMATMLARHCNLFFFSEGTQCHNMDASIGNVPLPARRHVEWRGEPVVEIPGKYVVQG